VHILLIEDDTEAAKFLVKGLRESGYSVDHAGDGREGLFRATEGHFDLVVTDRMLPHIDGLAIIQHMRQKGIATPVLVLSALGSVDDRVRGLKAGGDDYLTKPAWWMPQSSGWRISISTSLRGGSRGVGAKSS
jgi:two-component system OmpR family response regulator